MRIAQVAPPWIAVPPPGYGGIEWVVAALADGLADAGHEVTLFASGGSRTRARLESVFDPAPGPSMIADTYLEVLHAHRAYEGIERFDVVHDHSGMVGLALGARAPVPVVHTVHGRLDERALRLYGSLGDRVRLAAISDAQRASAPDLNWAGRVYNGIPLERYAFRADKEDFLLFVGRASPEKGVASAVEIARRTRARLVLAVVIKEPGERAYWRDTVEPLLTGREEILGEITVEEKADLMGRARAVLFPIDWPEPFGLVMTEAMACGTPVVAFPRGAAPEVIEDGVTGFLAEDLDAMCEAVGRLDAIDPKACRARVERLFSAEAMVAGYERVYGEVLASRA